MRKLRVLHVIDFLDPSQGGPPMAAAGLAAAQASLGHDVRIFCHESHRGDKEARVAMAGIPGIQGVTIVFCPVGGMVNKTTGLSDGRHFENISLGADIVHVHGIWRPILKTACRKSRNAGIKYVITPHGMLHPWALRQRRWKKKLAMLLGWRKTIEGSSFLHALNVDEADYLERLGIKANIEVLPNGIFREQTEMLPAATEFHGNHPELNNRPYILFIGRLHYVKGLDILAEAFRLFCDTNRDVDLVVVGPDGGQQRDFEALITRLGLAGRIHLVGPLYGREKYAALSGAACYCQPSHQEGFSMAITEAMACGLPVVISRNCNFPEVQKTGAGVVVDLGAREIGMALQYIFADNERRHRIGNNARNLVFNSFTWPRIAKQMISAYERALKS